LLVLIVRIVCESYSFTLTFKAVNHKMEAVTGGIYYTLLHVTK